ncbi:hypothetical protein [Ferrimicrobium acidiphilum]|uniref:hypothetical protein n=1 Tax=Ferrimicrobium acidiphilum TaxID=121039 RepID=UPI0023F51B5C|nr:hypothetical protein [Ferrimicrobium acidiphilum]
MTVGSQTLEALDDPGLSYGFSPPHIDDQQIASAIKLIDASGICVRVAKWRSEDQERAGKGRGGRPGSLNDRVVLVLLLVLALEGSPLLVTHAAAVVEHRLSGEARAMLGISPDRIGNPVWYDRFWRAFHSLLDVIDPFPGPRNRLLTVDEWADVMASRDSEECERKQERLDWVANQLLEASMRMIPRSVRRKWKGNVCIDATPIAAFGKRGTTKRSDWVSIEPDADWYVREGDHRDPGDDRGKQYRKTLWGWEATLAVMSTNDPSGPDAFPHLVVAIGFGKPGADIAGHGVRAFGSIVRRGHPVGMAIADRAYFPNSKPEDLQLPLRAMGYGLVFDYRKDQLGITESYAGAIQVEGAWYCPSMPQVLIEATIDFRVKKSIDKTTYAQRIEQRQRYLLRPKEKADQDGYTPMVCPAAGRSATVYCPLKTPVGKVAGRSRITIAPSHPDRICTNRSSVSFPPTAGAKYGQSLHSGSSEWHAMYATARNTIEGFNGYVKDANHEALDQPGRRRVRGYASQYLLTAMLVMSANLRKIDTFIRKHGKDEAAVAKPPRRPRRRDRLANYEPVASVLTDGDPPAD